FMFKRMALYNRSIHLERYWAVYEYIIFFLFVFNFFSPDIFQPGYYVVLVPISIYGLILSFNVKWVAYLNSKLKWRSLLLMFLLLAMALIFAYSVFQHSYYSNPAVDPARLVFLVAVMVFIICYSVVSHLVVLFNLPTSSVFEQKFEEVMSVQRLSESFLEGKTEGEMYGILSETSMATVLADGCWIESEDSEKIILLSGLTVSEVENVKNCLTMAEREGDSDLFIVKSLKESVKNSRFKYTKYASLVMLSLHSQKGKLARIYLVKEVRDGFDLEMVNILKTYVAQAAVSIENLRLLEKALQNERYATELVTAREVQKRLLPNGLIENEDFSMVAFCKTSEEMGGDYFDYFSLGNGRFAFVLGDVSGKGTSAAFNLAQVKGIFQALVQLNLPPIQFMSMANAAIGRCLEKSSFVTLTYCLVDSNTKTMEMVRAGHCPALVYSSQSNSSSFYRQKGLGLGILRGKDISTHLENVNYSYGDGDVVLLYSDGLSEARNPGGDEYGYDRIKNFVDFNHHLSTSEMQDKLIKEIEEFTHNDLSRDDLSFMVVKFKNSET
ncbi:MAG: serine/threonine-protein phosphatase, partial [Cytophagales bacterium]|nr:serine/threonine-protein phosphatase [Cytophagales bacterium]